MPFSRCGFTSWGVRRDRTSRSPQPPAGSPPRPTVSAGSAASAANALQRQVEPHGASHEGSPCPPHSTTARPPRTHAHSPAPFPFAMAALVHAHCDWVELAARLVVPSRPAGARVSFTAPSGPATPCPPAPAPGGQHRRGADDSSRPLDGSGRASTDGWTNRTKGILGLDHPVFVHQPR